MQDPSNNRIGQLQPSFYNHLNVELKDKIFNVQTSNIVFIFIIAGSSWYLQHAYKYRKEAYHSVQPSCSVTIVRESAILSLDDLYMTLTIKQFEVSVIIYYIGSKVHRTFWVNTGFGLEYDGIVPEPFYSEAILL